MPKSSRKLTLELVKRTPPAFLPNSVFERGRDTFKVSKATSPDYPPDGPFSDLIAVEAMLDQLRLSVEKSFAGDGLECRQDSAAVVVGRAVHLVHRARLAMTMNLTYQERQLINCFRACDERGRRGIDNACRIHSELSEASSLCRGPGDCSKLFPV